MPNPIDIDGARKAGYSDDEIIAGLSKRYPSVKFNEAIKAGYQLNEIADSLNKKGGDSNERSKTNTERQEGSTLVDNGRQGTQDGSVPTADSQGVRTGNAPEQVQDNSDPVKNLSGGDRGGSQSPPDASEKRPVGFAEETERASTGAAAQFNEDAAQIIGIAPYAIDKALNLFGKESDLYQKWMGLVYSTGLGQPGIDAAAINPKTEQLTTPGKIGEGIGGMATQLPIMAASGGIGGEIEGGGAILKAMTHGLKSMSVPAIQSGMQAVRQSADKGDNGLTQVAKGIAKTISTDIIGAVPLMGKSNFASPLARFIQQGAVGYLSSIPANESQKVVSSWVNGQPYVPSDLKSALIDAIPMALASGVFGAIAPSDHAQQEAINNNLPETAKVLSEQAAEPKPAEQPPAPISGIPSIQEQGGRVIEPSKESQPEQNRIAAAAYKDPATGVVYEGKNHEEAMRKAGVPEEQIPKGEEGQPQRETDNHGFTDESGQFHSREDAQKIAESSGQFDKVTDRPVMHASDTDLEKFAGKEEAKPEEEGFVKGMADKAREDIKKGVDDFGPGAASASEFKKQREAIGASLIFEGKASKAEWLDAMKSEVFHDETMSPQELNQLWRDSKGMVKDFQASQKGGISPKRAISQATEGKMEGRVSMTEKSALKYQMKTEEKGFKRGVKEGVRTTKEGIRPILQDLRSKLSDSITKAKGLGEYLRGMEKGSKIGAKSTKENADIALRWHDAEKAKIAESINTLLNETIPASGIKMRPGAMRAFNNQIQKILKTPFKWKGGITRNGEFTSSSEMMWKAAQDIMERVQHSADQALSVDLRNEIKSLHKEIISSKTVSVAERKAAKAMMVGIDAKDLSIEELQAMKTALDYSKKAGRVDWANTKEGLALMRDEKVKELLNDPYIKPLETRESVVRDFETGGIQKAKDGIYTATTKTLDWASLHEKARQFIPHLFKTLDGKEDGFLTRNLYYPVLTSMRNFRKANSSAREDAGEIIKRNGLTLDDQVKIALYSHFKQGGDESEPVKFSYEKEKIQQAIKEVKESGLNKGQKEFYDFAINLFKGEKEAMQEFFSLHHNIELKFEDDYTPRAVDKRKSGEWFKNRSRSKDKADGGEMDAQDIADEISKDVLRGRTRYINKGFSKDRVKGAELPLNLNFADVVLQRHEDWQYLKNLQPVLSEMGKISDTDIFREKYGDMGKSLVADYLDAIAKRGKYAQNTAERALTAVKSAAGTGTLGFRLEQFKHLASYPMGMDAAGGADWWARGVAFSKTAEGKAWIKENWPELYERSAGDVAITEATSKNHFASKIPLVGKLTSKAFAIDRFLDYTNASGIGIGAHMKALHESGQDWKAVDKSSISDEDLNSYTKKIVTTVGSPMIEDRPLLVTKGTSVGSQAIGSALVAYQSPKMVRWGRLRNTISQDLIRDRNYAKTAKELSLLGSSSLIEASVKYGSKAGYAVAAGGIMAALGIPTKQIEEDADGAWNTLSDIGEEAAADFLSSIPLAGGTTEKMYQAYKYKGSRREILSQTGIAPIDMTTAALADATELVFNLKEKSVLKLGMDISQMTGLPFAPVTALVKAGEKIYDKPAE